MIDYINPSYQEIWIISFIFIWLCYSYCVLNLYLLIKDCFTVKIFIEQYLEKYLYYVFFIRAITGNPSNNSGVGFPAFDVTSNVTTAEPYTTAAPQPNPFSNNQFWSDLYAKPWCRIAVYFIGMATGFILYDTKGQRLMNKVIRSFLWFYSITERYKDGENILPSWKIRPGIKQCLKMDVQPVLYPWFLIFIELTNLLFEGFCDYHVGSHCHRCFICDIRLDSSCNWCIFPTGRRCSFVQCCIETIVGSVIGMGYHCLRSWIWRYD